VNQVVFGVLLLFKGLLTISIDKRKSVRLSTGCGGMQVFAKSAVASAVAQEVLRLGNNNNLQMRVARSDTEVSGIHIPEGTNVWLCPQQVCALFYLDMLSSSMNSSTCMHCCCLTQKVFMHHTW
jgi:hypothetical protein